jgi:hypothetical protein
MNRDPLISLSMTLLPLVLALPSACTDANDPSDGGTDAQAQAEAQAAHADFKTIFTTQKRFLAEALDGIDGADARCGQVASAAKLNGTFKAWISDATTSAASRLSHAAVPYRLVNGAQVAADVNLYALTASLRGAGERGWIASLDFAGGRGTGFRELDAAGLAGYVVSAGERRLRGDLSLQLGAGITTQARDAGGSFRSGALLAVPALGVSAALTSGVALRAQAQLSTMLLSRDHDAAVLVLPSVLFGAAFSL